MFKFNHFKIGARMGAGFAAVLILVVLMMAVGIWSLQRSTASMRAMMDVPLQKERLVDEWYNANTVGASRNASIVMTDDDDFAKSQIADAQAAATVVTELTEKIVALAISPAEKELLKKGLSENSSG